MTQIIDDSYDMQEEIRAAFTSMDSQTFSRLYGQPSGIVDYSQLPETKGERHHALKEVRQDIQQLSDDEFDLRYHDTKDIMARRLDAWRFLDMPLWCAGELVEIYLLSDADDVSSCDLELRLKNAQNKGLLGNTFTPSEGIQWLKDQGLRILSDFSHLWYSTYDEPVPTVLTALQAKEVEEKGKSGLTKREQQIQAIESEALAANYDLLNIPTGGKAALRGICKKDHAGLFGAGNDPFNDAWQDAISHNPPRLRMAEHHIFARR